MVNRTLCICFAIFAILVSNASAKDRKKIERISFKLYHDHLVIASGALGDIPNRNLLIDTGATPSVVDEALAFELGLKPVGRPASGISVVGGVVQTYYAILKSIDLGPVHREAVPVAVANLSFMQAEVGIRIDAIVGLDVLENINFQIDYEAEKIRFGKFRVSSAVPMLRNQHLAIVISQLNGTPLKLAVDTGSSQLVVFNNALSDRVRLFPGRKVQLSNVAGDVMASTVRLQNFSIADLDLSGTTAVLANVPQCCEFDGILGISTLRFRKLSFDFEQQRLGIELIDRNEFSPTGRCQAALSGLVCDSAFLARTRP